MFREGDRNSRRDVRPETDGREEINWRYGTIWFWGSST